MSRSFINAFALLGCFLSAQSACAHPISAAAAWGDPVDGIQLQVAVAKTATPRPVPGDLHRLAMQLHNVGTDTVTFSSVLCQRSRFEIDGVWYRIAAFGGGADRPPPPLVPGSESGILICDPTQLLELDTNGKVILSEPIALKPGTHLVRVRTPDGGGVLDSKGRAIILMSNAISVQTTAVR